MFKLPDLPYGYDALQPTISELTMRTHHDKHHAAYVNTTNQILGERGETPSSLEDVIRAAKDKGEQRLFNQSGQAWNHAFFWACMAPQGGRPSGALAEAIAQFGGLDQLKSKFVAEGVGHFASGWVWLIADRSGALKVTSTHDADTALVHEGAPLLVCDLWEHAYYLDYKNDRKGFLEHWFDTVANWSFAEQQLQAAKGQGQAYRYPAPQA